MSKQEDQYSLPLSRIFQSPTSKVLDFLFVNRDFDYSESDIASLSNTAPRTLQRVLIILKKEKLIKKTRKSNRSNMYKANLENKLGEYLSLYVRTAIENQLDTVPEIGISSKSVDEPVVELNEITIKKNNLIGPILKER